MGNIMVNGHTLKEGDAVAMSGERAVMLAGCGPSGGELLLIDLA
jgi:hypothetical protein